MNLSIRFFISSTLATLAACGEGGGDYSAPVTPEQAAANASMAVMKTSTQTVTADNMMSNLPGMPDNSDNDGSENIMISSVQVQQNVNQLLAQAQASSMDPMGNGNKTINGACGGQAVITSTATTPGDPNAQFPTSSSVNINFQQFCIGDEIESEEAESEETESEETESEETGSEETGSEETGSEETESEETESEETENEETGSEETESEETESEETETEEASDSITMNGTVSFNSTLAAQDDGNANLTYDINYSVVSEGEQFTDALQLTETCTTTSAGISCDNAFSTVVGGDNYTLDTITITGDNNSGYSLTGILTDEDGNQYDVMVSGLTQCNNDNIATGDMELTDNDGETTLASISSCSDYTVSYQGIANTYSQDDD